MVVLRPLLALGIPGFKGILLIALVALALYGRGGSRLLMASRTGRSLSPWLNLVRVAPAAGKRAGASVGPSPAPAAKRHSRWFWALALTAAAAVAASVATRLVIHFGSGTTH